MENQQNSNTEMDMLGADPNSEAEQKSTMNLVMKKKLRLGGKKVCIGISIISVIIVWITLLTPLTAVGIRIVTSNLTSVATVTNTIFNLLPPINVTSNYSNFTIERIECVDNFVYVPRDEMCYPECDWNPSGDDSTKIVQLFLDIFSIVSIVLCTATLIAWLLLSCIDWKKVRFHYDFQLPRTSLFMVVLSSLFLVVLNASIDLMPRDFFFCQSTENGQSYLLAHLFYSISNITYNKLVTNVIGALYHYLFLVIVSWIIFSLINIIVIIFWPHFRESFKRRVLAFSIQCLICFGFNLIPVVLVIAQNHELPYVASYLINNVSILDSFAFLILFEIPFFLTPGVLISLIIVIVAKLRILSLKSTKTTGRAIKLTDLEKRLIAYGIVLMTLMSFQGINLIFLSLVSLEYFEVVTKFILCITVNSPILTLPSDFTGRNATLNDTVPVYRENPYGDLNACKMFESEADRLFPQFTLILVNVLFRLIWLPVFFVLIPHAMPKLLKKWYAGLKEKYSSRNAFIFSP